MLYPTELRPHLLWNMHSTIRRESLDRRQANFRYISVLLLAARASFESLYDRY